MIISKWTNSFSLPRVSVQQNKGYRVEHILPKQVDWFFRRRTKEFPLATKVIVFGLVSKKMLAQKANAPDNIPSHFLARALALVVVYSLSFSNNMIQLQAFYNISFLFFYFWFLSAIAYAFTADIRPSLFVYGKARHRLILSSVKECNHVRLRLRRQG